jgi:hypothetical protein
MLSLNGDGSRRYTVPYLRLYSPDLLIEQKRVITQKLIEITLRTFHLRPEERHSITVQFIPPPEVSEINSSQVSIPGDTGIVLEVIAHHLTDAKERAFREEAATLLPPLLRTKAGKISRLLGFKPDPRRQVALQFAELSPAISDPFTEDSERRAA